jgi:pyruvate formate lyase activating enzyme
MVMEAYLYEPFKENIVRCNLCAHRCLIKPKERGICRVRENDAGVLKTLVFGKVIAQHIDPIEKKPLFHFMPGTRSFSIATVGCNFKCRFCQNADIAQMPEDRKGLIMGEDVATEDVVNWALGGNCASISYTYTEPTVYFEFAYETAKIAKEKGLKNVFVTNGYMSPEMLLMAAPFLDGANVDLKAFSDDFYKSYCHARLEPVKNTLKLMKKLGIWIEITTLLIPGLNDDPGELKQLAEFIVKDLGPEIPWHISRFHPTYRLTDRPATPVETLIRTREIGISAGLAYVYIGNVPGESGESTFCPACKTLLIDRWGFSIRKNSITNGRCPHCNAMIHGIGL